MVRNIRLTLAYDGGAYAGWQVQPDQPTVAATLERAIHELTGETVAVLSAGRTDAGVHALGQAANFQTSASIPAEKWRPALQSKLPPDIVVLESQEAPLDFHATYAAKSKRYRYVIHNALVDNPFLRRFAWRLGGDLDDRAMHAAAQALVGTHDFRSFESHWPNTAHSIRTVSEIAVFRAAGWRLWQPLAALVGSTKNGVPAPADEAGDSRRPASGGVVTDSAASSPAISKATSAADDLAGEAAPPFVCLEICADGFLYNMVRSIVGTLVNVGRGRWDVPDVQSILEARDRHCAGETAPAQGLYLVSVEY
jgi:tRNA pseudouridine38-40 synthase